MRASRSWNNQGCAGQCAVYASDNIKGLVEFLTFVASHISMRYIASLLVTAVISSATYCSEF
jgi:hypothetical protein